MKKLTSLFFILLFLLISPYSAWAIDKDSVVFKAKVLKSEVVDCGDMTSQEEYECVQYEVEIISDERKGENITTQPTWLNNEEDIFKEGSKVYISQTEYLEGEVLWNIESYSREGALLFLFLVFVFLIIIVGGKKGVMATLGLILSFLVIYFFAIPRINMGSNLFLISSMTIFVLLIASTFVTYGLNMKSLIAFISTLLGIVIILALGYWTISALNISGMGEEASAMLFETSGGILNLSSIFLLSILIGALGVLDDVTVGQVSSMMEIRDTDSTLCANELFKRSMNIGKDHIASMVNTLFIAYAGSSFTLVMLLSANNPDFRVLINTGFVIEEVVRTLIASIGIVLIVPITSFIASRIVVRAVKN